MLRRSKKSMRTCSHRIKYRNRDRHGALGWGLERDMSKMAARSNALMSALASAVRLHPRLSAGLAFELGVMVGAFVKSARSRGLKDASARLIEAVPLIAQSPP